MDKTPCNSQEAEVRKGPWTMEEDLILINYIANHGEGVWNSLAKAAGIQKFLETQRARKRKYRIFFFFSLFGGYACELNPPYFWLCFLVGLKRTGKSCRLRWLNYLRPDVKRGNITPEEQLLIMELHAKWGNRLVYIYKTTGINFGCFFLPTPQFFSLLLDGFNFRFQIQIFIEF